MGHPPAQYSSLLRSGTHPSYSVAKSEYSGDRHEVLTISNQSLAQDPRPRPPLPPSPPPRPPKPPPPPRPLKTPPPLSLPLPLPFPLSLPLPFPLPFFPIVPM